MDTRTILALGTVVAGSCEPERGGYKTRRVLLSVLLDILAPILLMVGLGALLRWKFAIDVTTLSKLNIFLFTPAFVFDRVSSSRLHWGEMGGIVLVTLLLVLTLGLLTWLVGRSAGVGRKTLSAVALATMFYNSGNYGLPLAELAFPRGGVHDGGAAQTFVLLTQNVLTFTLGLAIAASAHASGWRNILLRMLSLPVLYTLAAALVARHFFGPDSGRVMPTLLAATVRYLSSALVPVALVTLGAQLASNPRWPRWRPVALVIVVRLLVGPTLMAGLLWTTHALLPGTILDLWPWPAQLLILTAGVPSAINILLLTIELEGDPELGAACVFWTTIFSALTLTGWLVLLRSMF